MSSELGLPPVDGGLLAGSGPDLAVSLDNVSKCFQIYERPEDRLKQSIVSRLRRWTGRPAKLFFKEFWALRGVSAQIRRGETVGIVGRNGSGKSTLLQILCGTLTPTGGRVEVRGRVAALLELGSGFNPEFSGRENVFLNATVLGLTREQIEARYDDIIAFADIGEFISQPVKTYSSGMYVRLAFAVIAHADADILVIDEALSVGDVFFSQKCMRFLRKFQENGTVIFVSHDSSAVVALCDRALLLESGSLTMAGSAKEVCEAYHAGSYEMTPRPARVTSRSAAPDRDVRSEAIRASALRNELQVFSFDPDRAGFGNGAASITSARLVDSEGLTLSNVVGGDAVSLVINAAVHRYMPSPIVGFFLKDRLGQALFGDNTYLSYQLSPVAAAMGSVITASFDFTMPILPRGSYTFDVAVANGTYLDHEQADWVHDAFVVESLSSSVSVGLVGIPFRSITLENSNSAARDPHE